MTEENGQGYSSRFSRIEQALLRIEEKLDQKAAATDVDRLEIRIAALETGTSPYQKQLIEQFMVSQQRLSSLELKTTTSEAVQQAINSSKANATRLTIAIIGIGISAAGTLAGIVWQVINAIRH